MKNFTRILAFCLLAFVILGLASCKVKHEHDFSTDWYNDSSSHWKICIGDGCSETADKADHTYGEGVVTTEPTEFSEGVKTYTCTVCGYAKLESIPMLKPHEHTYADEWSSDETYHWHASTCGHDDSEKEEHIFDDGWVEIPATDTESGVIIYTCIGCGYYYEDELEPLIHVHKYSDEWSYDEEFHWHAATCGHDNKRDKARHELDDGVITTAPTEDAEGVKTYSCTTCDYKKTEPVEKLPHTHKFATEYSYDNDYHWYASTCGHDETVTKTLHNWDDGIVTTEPTEDTEGVKTFTCSDCGNTKTLPVASLNHTHTYAAEYSKDGDYHWFEPTCGHVDAVEKVAHDFSNGNCVCGYHALCELCNKCVLVSCTVHTEKCLFADSNKVVIFSPNTEFGAAEGPDGLAPGSAGAYLHDTSIVAVHEIIAGGIPATTITLPNGTAAHSGTAFRIDGTRYQAPGLAGYNVAIPMLGNVVKVVRMHFTNTGSSEITLKYSLIDYYYDYGVVEVTLQAGESKTVLMNALYNKKDYPNTVGLNHQIVFPNGAEEGASFNVWGEFVADELNNGISIGVSANKLTYYVGDTFTSEGLILRGSSTYVGNAADLYNRVYISRNYVTNYDGHTFTAADAGEKTVTVTFAGQTTTYKIIVINHDVDKCATCGKCTNQVCDVAGCNDKCQGHFDPESMTVMSFNLGTNGINNEYNKANLLAKLVKELPDLLGTQEQNSLWTAAINDTLARYGYKNVIMYREGVTNSELGNEGAGIWYNSLRFTLEDWGYFWMSDTPDQSSIWDQYGALYKRVTTWARFTDKASGKSFVYYNTHIGYESEELWLRTADMIMERMHADYNAGYPVIITGDFNFALNTEGAMPAYERFMLGLNDSHYDAIIKNYEEGKQNTYSGYGEYQGSGDENTSDVGNRKHVLPIDYILYSGEFIAKEYTILREELPAGITTPDRQYFSSDHFAIKTVFGFADTWGTHICWEPCEKCGLCRDDECELCTEKCPKNHHTCDVKCPDCGLCVNADGECKAEYCPQYKVTLDGATFEGGSNVFYGCKLSAAIVTDSTKTFEGFIDANKNYYTVEDLANIDLTANVKYTALYQEDMLAWAQSDTCSYATLASAEHRVVNGLYVTTVTFPKDAPADTFFAGRGSKDSGSMALNWCAPANGKNIGIVYLYSYATKDIQVEYMTENYGAQNEELIFTLKPGLNRIVLTFAIQSSNNSFYSCDHRLILRETATEDVVIDTYGYFYTDGLIENFAASTPNKVVYKPGDTFTLDGIKVTAKVKGYTSTIHKYVTSIPVGYVFTADDIGIKTITVSMGDYKATVEIEVVDADCDSGKHYNVKNTIDANFAGMVGSDAMYNYVCAFCGAKSEETYAIEKILFTPHSNIGGGHKIEFVTLDDGRIAAKLTFNSDVSAGTKFTITNSSALAGTNVYFPIRNSGRLYMEMLSTADITLTWQPEYYGDRDPVTMDLIAGEAQGKSWIVTYDNYGSNAPGPYSSGPYQEIVAGTNIAKGTVVYLTGYFYPMDNVTGVSLKTAANTTTFKVGDEFSAAGLSLKPISSDSLYDNVAIYNVTTNLDGYTFTADDIGTKIVTVQWGNYTYAYQITITE